MTRLTPTPAVPYESNAGRDGLGAPDGPSSRRAVYKMEYAMKKERLSSAWAALFILAFILTAASCKTQTKDTSSGQTAVDERAPSGAPVQHEAATPSPSPVGVASHPCPYAQQEAAEGAAEPACPHHAGGEEAACPRHAQAQAAAGPPEGKITCPVGGEPIEDISKALKSVYRGKTYYFGCEVCKKKFDADPEKYAK
jgi:YHS domain-containing protein